MSKRLLNYIIVLLVCLISSAESFAQGTKFQVKGNVTDASREPIVGATIKVKGTSQGVITNIDGEYSIDTRSNAILAGRAACTSAAGQGTPPCPSRRLCPGSSTRGWVSVPMRSSGPCRSMSSWGMPTAWIMSSQSLWAERGPWERFMRMPVMPASTMRCKVSGWAQAGPMVP